MFQKVLFSNMEFHNKTRENVSIKISFKYLKIVYSN